MKDEERRTPGPGRVQPSSFRVQPSGPPSASPLDLKTRTREFALRVIRLCSALPKPPAAKVIGNQLLRSGTSVGAQYREGCRGRSDAEFVRKVESALQELEESIYWMELLVGSGTFPEDRMDGLMSEAGQLAAMLVTCAKKVKARKRKR